MDNDKDKREAFPYFIEQIYFPGLKPKLEVINQEESIQRGYGTTGYHKENCVDVHKCGLYTVHVTGARSEKEARDFKDLVDRS